MALKGVSFQLSARIVDARDHPVATLARAGHGSIIRARSEEPAMAVNIRIPSVLRNLTAGKETIEVLATTVDEALAAVEAAHPGIKARLCDETGKLRRFVNVFVGEEDIRFLDGQKTALKSGDLVDIVPAIAGGTR